MQQTPSLHTLQFLQGWCGGTFGALPTNYKILYMYISLIICLTCLSTAMCALITSQTITNGMEQ